MIVMSSLARERGLLVPKLWLAGLTNIFVVPLWKSSLLEVSRLPVSILSTLWVHSIIPWMPRGDLFTNPWVLVLRTEVSTGKAVQTSELNLGNLLKICGKKKAHWQRPSHSKLNFQVRFLPPQEPRTDVETQLSSQASFFLGTTKEY